MIGRTLQQVNNMPTWGCPSMGTIVALDDSKSEATFDVVLAKDDATSGKQQLPLS